MKSTLLHANVMDFIYQDGGIYRRRSCVLRTYVVLILFVYPFLLVKHAP